MYPMTCAGPHHTSAAPCTQCDDAVVCLRTCWRSMRCTNVMLCSWAWTCVVRRRTTADLNIWCCDERLPTGTYPTGTPCTCGEPSTCRLTYTRPHRTSAERCKPCRDGCWMTGMCPQDTRCTCAPQLPCQMTCAGPHHTSAAPCTQDSGDSFRPGTRSHRTHRTCLPASCCTPRSSPPHHTTCLLYTSPSPRDV